jgi:hypothetical protein
MASELQRSNSDAVQRGERGAGEHVRHGQGCRGLVVMTSGYRLIAGSNPAPRVQGGALVVFGTF